jgi:hypothetical protein
MAPGDGEEVRGDAERAKVQEERRVVESEEAREDAEALVQRLVLRRAFRKELPEPLFHQG